MQKQINGIKNRKNEGISADCLKVIAMVTMVIDHTGAVLFPQQELWRVIGRIAFPIYVWLLIMGFVHTSSVQRYIGRMAVFSLISEIPFDLALTGTICTFRWQNVFWTLTISLLMLAALKKVLDQMQDERAGGRGNIVLKTALIILLTMALSEWLHFDYGAAGPALAAVFYFYARYQRPSLLTGFCLFCLAFLMDPVLNGNAGSSLAWYYAVASISSECFGILAIPVISRYNGIRKWKRGKYFFYLFYPLHLLILYGLAMVR